MTPDVCQFALAYARAGIPVVPVGRDKRPYFKGWRNAATTDPEQIRAWWEKYPSANVVAPTGVRSRFIVLDIDPRNGGTDALADLVAEHGSLPATLTCETGGGGLHHYFSLPDFSVRSCDVAAGVEVLGERKAVTLPPSLHASGQTYRWSGTVRSLAPAPTWLLDRVRPRERPASPLEPIAISDAYVSAAVERECYGVRIAPEGSRNRTLNAAAFSLGQLVGGGALSRDVADAVLTQSAEECGLPASEAAATIRSGLRAGAANPRAVRARGRSS